ncbi:MAG: hypothetical protein WBX30_21745, partial [Stellaceae bacterium]
MRGYPVLGAALNAVRYVHPLFVMAGLDPAIYVSGHLRIQGKLLTQRPWMPGSSPQLSGSRVQLK